MDCSKNVLQRMLTLTVASTLFIAKNVFGQYFIPMHQLQSIARKFS